ncbi:MAG: hypothetical protein HY434_01040 [Candidatus Liptonbacteria bacterium]|nr:hypothetical protein [Candidatus Niyogibacteria bacterium]MBI4087399.1 hypothetical protein [Candidatus Liptonbacteria bacterium]
MIIKTAGINAALTALYIILIASFLFYGPRAFAPEDTVFAPIAMLSLLVFSAALVGFLVLGRPILWYLDGRKREAVALLMYTLGFLLLLPLGAFLVLFWYR